MKSLERQLQISLATVLLLILLALMVIANFSTRSLLEEFVTSRLESDAKRLLEVLDIDSSVAKVRWRRLNPTYSMPNSGYYYAIKINGGEITEKFLFSPSLQGETIPTRGNTRNNKPTRPTTLHNISGPQDQHLIVWSQTYNKNGQSIIISIAEDMSMLMRNRQYFTLLFISMGLIGFILMLVLQRFVIRRLFKHLDVTRQEVTQIESGGIQQLSENVPSEIYPLVKEFNHSLSLMQQRMKRSRNSLGNLAHALKTPLSLLIQQLEGGSMSGEQALKQAERIRQLTERELKRARMAGLGNTTQRFDPREELPTLIEVLKQAHHKSDFQVNLDIDDTVKVFGDREDMLELLGNVMDNAFKWAESQVCCSLVIIEKTGNVHIMIEDDGIGKAPQELEQIAQRGVRLDETVEGHGLGLAISKDIVKLYAGTIHFNRSEKLGGFYVEISIPLN